MRLCRGLWLIGGIFLAQVAFAECSNVSPETGSAESRPALALATSAGQQRNVEDRTVLLKLMVSKSGRVREATVLKGPTALVPAAVEAAKRRKYKHRTVVSSPDTGEMTVAVMFPKDNNGAPEIKQALSAGVSSCLHPDLSQIAPPSWLTLFLSERRPIPVLAVPALAPETKK
jgi:hypothetical protein